MKSHVLIIGLYFQFLCFSLFPQEFSTLSEIYDFNHQDEFQILKYNCCNDVFFQLHELRILERTEEQGSLNYIRNSSLFLFVFANPPILVDTIHLNIIDTLAIPYPDSVIFNFGDEIISNPNIYNGRKICIKHSSVMGNPKTDKYVNGCGLAVTSWPIESDTICRISDSLVYFKKEKDEWGVNRLLNVNEAINKRNLLVYPNPVIDILYIKPLIHHTKLQLSFYDLAAKQLLSVTARSKEIYQIDLSHFKKGVYLLHINMADRNKVYPIVKF